MFKKIHFSLIFFLFVGIIFGQENSRYSGTLSISAHQDYTGDIVGGIFYPDPNMVIMGTISRNDAHGSSYGGFWLCRGVTNLRYNSDGGDEYDVFIGRVIPLAKKSIIIDAGMTYLAVYPLGHFNGHVWTGQVRVDLPKAKYIQPYFKYYHFGQVGSTSPIAGEFFFAGATRNQHTPLRIYDRPIVMGFDYRFGYSGGALGADCGPAYNRLTVNLQLSVSKKISIIPEVSGQIPFKRVDPFRALGDRPRTTGSITVEYRW